MTQVTISPKGFMSVSQYANKCGVTVSTVYNWINNEKVDSQTFEIMGNNRHMVKDRTVKRALRRNKRK